MQRRKITNFGWYDRRWQRHDHLVVIGHNEANTCFFMFDKRQLAVCAKHIDWGIFGTHDPVKRLKLVLDSVDTQWSRVSDCWYHESVVVGSAAKRHYHLVALKCREVPEVVREHKTEVPLGYIDFARADLDNAGLPKELELPVMQVMNVLERRHVA